MNFYFKLRAMQIPFLGLFLTSIINFQVVVPLTTVGPID
jgi:hypothetical protein